MDNKTSEMIKEAIRNGKIIKEKINLKEFGLKLLHPSCAIITIKLLDGRRAAVCFAKINCLKFREKYRLTPSCFSQIQMENQNGNALLLRGPFCGLSAFTTRFAVAVCSAKGECPKKNNKYKLTPQCFVLQLNGVEWAKII